MNNFLVLFVGELQRMKKYNIFAASLLVSFLWIGMLYFTDIRNVSGIFPLLIYLDATSMAMLLVGVTMFYEKHEGTIKTLLVTPISKVQYILAKTWANILTNIITLIILFLYARFFRDLNVNIIGLLGAVILVSFFHSLVGVVLTYYSKDFTALLMGVMKYAFILMLPVLFEQMGMITNEMIKRVLYLLPTKASMILLQASTGVFRPWEIYFSILYMAGMCILLYFAVWKKFDEFAVRESGV